MTFLAGCYQVVCSLLNGSKFPLPPMKLPRRLSSPKRIAIAGGQQDVSRPQLYFSERLMVSDIPHQVTLTVAASFLPHFFLENLAIRHDNSILVTVVTRKELWYIPLFPVVKVHRLTPCSFTPSMNLVEHLRARTRCILYLYRKRLHDA